jgi:hypothetical protein
MARKRGKRMSKEERKAMFARLEKGKSRVGKARKVRTTSNTFVYKKAGDEFVFQNKSKDGNNDYDITKTLDRDEAKGFLKDVLGSEMSLRAYNPVLDMQKTINTTYHPVTEMSKVVGETHRPVTEMEKVLKRKLSMRKVEDKVKSYPSTERFKVIDTIPVPHPYCIAPKHLELNEGMVLDIPATEAKGAVCDICRKAAKKTGQPILPYSEHKQALLVEVNDKRELKDIPELKKYLLSIKEKAEKEGYVGFAFIASDETSPRKVSYNAYFDKYNTTDNEGKRARLLVADVPNNKGRIEELKGVADWFTVHPDTGHYDFSAKASNPQVRVMLDAEAKNDFAQKKLMPFYERNKDSISEYYSLMLENGLHGSFIESQLFQFAQNPTGSYTPYVDARVGFKGGNRFGQIINQMREREKSRK